uniref:Uncharacterized protein n=1 Tax=Spongospora subterranea TaxID=70186 RepID=A0A0H5QYD7_9EUKA|eukprot:CRZ06993.1 hypothetical protein [Spongospora subterranea]
MLQFITDFAIKRGFRLARTTNRMNKERALEFFNDENIIQRRHVYCNIGNRGSKACPFHVPFTCHFHTREAVFKKGFNFEHNHVLSATLGYPCESNTGTADESGPPVPIWLCKRYSRYEFPTHSRHDSGDWMNRAKS